MTVELLFLALLWVLGLTVAFYYFGSFKAIFAFLRQPNHWGNLLKNFSFQSLKEIPSPVLYTVSAICMLSALTLLPVVYGFPFPALIKNISSTFLIGMFTVSGALIGLTMYTRKEYPGMLSPKKGKIIQFMGLVMVISCMGLLIWFIK